MRLKDLYSSGRADLYPEEGVASPTDGIAFISVGFCFPSLWIWINPTNWRGDVPRTTKVV